MFDKCISSSKQIKTHESWKILREAIANVLIGELGVEISNFPKTKYLSKADELIKFICKRTMQII